MLRKLSLAIAAAMMLSGAALAASTFPSSVTEAGPNYAAPTAAAPARFGGATLALGEVRVPSSVSESMPEMTGDVDHPTHTGATAGVSAPRLLRGGAASTIELPPLIND